MSKEIMKPVIPLSIARWIEECQNNGLSLRYALYEFEAEAMKFSLPASLCYATKEMREWIEENGFETFALAWLLGYEVEEERRYKVRLPGLFSRKNYLLCDRRGKSWYLGEANSGDRLLHTRKELEEADFGWVFKLGFAMEEKK